MIERKNMFICFQIDMLKAIPQDNSIEDIFLQNILSLACACMSFSWLYFHSGHVPIPLAYQLLFRELTVEVRLH